ncbi:MAG: nucleotide modification associated domain-containing protein [Patescibacteria group bacterium]
MGKFEDLKAKMKVSPEANYKGFRAAAGVVAKYKVATASSRGTGASFPEIDKAYNQISNTLINAQVAEKAEYRRRVSEAAASLAYYSVLFHLNFFEPNFFGLTKEDKFQKCLRQMTILFRKKNRDYGNSFRFWGIAGLLVRLGDKIFRLQQLTTRGYKQKVKDERIPDTALDLANYSLMLLMLLTEGRSLKLGR